jgi:hypothetical protein
MKTGNAAIKIPPRMMVMAAYLFFTACTPHQDIGRFTQVDANSFCEARFGMRITDQDSFVTGTRPSAEDIAGSKFSAALCKRAVPAELFLDSQGQLESIQFSAPSQCLKDVCVGDRFDKVVTDRFRWNIFSTAEEGGILTVRKDDAVIYTFDTQGIPLDCFVDAFACPRKIAAARVNGIVLHRTR